MHTYLYNNIFLGTTSKKYIKHAMDELKNAAPDIKRIDSYPEGIFSFAIKKDKDTFISHVIEGKPVYLRHIHPVDMLIPILDPGNTPDIVLEGILPLIAGIEPGKKVAVQARRIPGNYDWTLFSIKKAIDEYFTGKTGIIPTVKNPDLILSIFITDSSRIDYQKSLNYNLQQDFAPPSFWNGFILAGLSTPRQNLCEWSGGIVRFAKEDDQVSRAEFKLLEAFEIFRIETKPNGHALDLGASPGGWTRVLAEAGYRVTAVDRAPLEPAISGKNNVRYIQRDARHFRDDKDVYDIVTCDINGDPIQAARALVGSAPSVKKGSPLIMTVKLSGKSPDKIIDKTLKTLKEAFSVERLRQLYHNRDEITIYGLKV